jgi:hypothetical protein
MKFLDMASIGLFTFGVWVGAATFFPDQLSQVSPALTQIVDGGIQGWKDGAK